MEPSRIHRTAEKLHPRNQSAAREFCRIAPLRIYRPLSARIIPPMTRHKHTHTGLVTPQLPQLWLTAVLHVFAMLVSNVCSTLQMIRRRQAVNATRATPPVLPRETSDTCKEPKAAQHRSPPALMLRSAAKLRVSKHAGVLNTVSHTAPSPSVSLAPQAIHLPLLRRWRQEAKRNCLHQSKTGGGGLRALARKTEGASLRITAP